MTLSEQDLRELAAELARRPGHEKVRHLVSTILERQLGLPVDRISYEEHLTEVHGFVDALLGRTIFEFKSDLRSEARDAELQAERYLEELEGSTGHRHIAIATDGATFQPYILRDGQLVPLEPYRTAADRPEELVTWLDHTVVLRDHLDPTPEKVRDALGRGSVAWQVGRQELAELWDAISEDPGVRLKRDLWARMLEMVYGSEVGSDDLFFQHTYLTVIAKTMGTRVLGLPAEDPAELLAGKAFSDAGIAGAIEPDFFDWPLATSRGESVVSKIIAQADRFELEQVQTDVLKGLYESLIDPEQRHDLGEYYTPDWLAQRICERVITDPLKQRVLDPACGSGTFLFHAVRRYLAAADDAEVPSAEAVAGCTANVRGIDVHPVAAIIARVTYLLAIGERLQERGGAIAVPVYLGDALQWHRFAAMHGARVDIEVPDGPTLRFPASVTADPQVFDRVIHQMLSQEVSEEGFVSWLVESQGITDRDDVRLLRASFEAIHQLQAEGRNHIWGYVARNQSRPVWLSSDDQLSDVLVGNPPWLAYRYMDPEMQRRFKAGCQELGLWKGGKVATHQDLSAYFFSRCVDLYLAPCGTIAFVMPRAVLTRQQYEGFRDRHLREGVAVQVTEGWDLHQVEPLFEVPSCVLIARNVDKAVALPQTIRTFSGTLPRRDASSDEAATVLTEHQEPWPGGASHEGEVPAYSEVFRQGATVVPRRLFLVERVPAGKLGVDPSAPVVRSREGSLDKAPWKDLPPLKGPVERQFLRPLYLGESIAPFRPLAPALAVIPWDERHSDLMDAAVATQRGFPHLAKWLRQAERLWESHKSSDMSLSDQLDYYGKLSAQFPIPPVRLLYTASGTNPCAAVLQDQSAVVEHNLYWAALDIDEARYLEALLNSEGVRRRLEPYQSRGQWGPRHIDKYILRVIPAFDPNKEAHLELVTLAARAEAVTAAVELRPGMRFTQARKLIRQVLTEDGVAADIERAAEAVMESSPR